VSPALGEPLAKFLLRPSAFKSGMPAPNVYPQLFPIKMSGPSRYDVLLAAFGYRDSQWGKENMNVGVFEKLTAFNRCMEDVVMILKAFEMDPDFHKGSVELFTLDAETLRAGVNRYVGERLVGVSDEESTKLDAIRDARKPETEEEP
jgi:hypothetical protein